MPPDGPAGAGAAAARVGRFRTADGLSLFFRDWAGDAARTPVLCLAGLTRSGRDFEPLAARLAPARRVIALDARGRGGSGPDPKTANYNPLTEAGDALALLDHLGIARAAIVGTSRGGIVGMLAALGRPERVAGLALNDVGPVIEPAGIARILAYLAEPPPVLESWAAATALVRGGLAPAFPDLDDAAWEAHARRTFRDLGGRPALDYDPALRQAVVAQAADAPADLWPQFEALGPMPLLALRGENSDILSTATLAEMRRRRPAMQAVEVRGRGHAPFLDEPEALAAIGAFLEAAQSAPVAQP